MSLDGLVARLDDATTLAPRTDHLAPLDVRLMARAQRVGLKAMRRQWDIRLHDRSYIPRRGPVIIAANHIGTLDGPLVVLGSGRPTYALAKDELFDGVVGRALAMGGQIPLSRTYADFPALRRAVHVLREGHALAIFPEGVRNTGDFSHIKGGLAYLALVTGAPVVPCAIFGTRLRGAGRKAIPPKGARIDIVYGRPIKINAMPWPRRREQVAELTEYLRGRLSAHVVANERWTRMELPGPVEP